MFDGMLEEGTSACALLLGHLLILNFCFSFGPQELYFLFGKIYGHT